MGGGEPLPSSAPASSGPPIVGGLDEYGLRDSEDSRSCGGGVEFLDALKVSRVVSFLRDNSITDVGI